jgi:arginase
VLLGPRDREELRDAGIPSLSATTSFLSDADLQQVNVGAIGRSMAERLHALAGKWWFHLDLDVLSSDALAAVRYRQPGGMDWHQLGLLTHSALVVPGVVGLNLTIYNPDLDPTGAGAARVVEFISGIAATLAQHKS